MQRERTIYNLLQVSDCEKGRCEMYNNAIKRIRNKGIRRMQAVNTDSEDGIQWHSGIEFNIVRILLNM